MILTNFAIRYIIIHLVLPSFIFNERLIGCKQAQSSGVQHYAHTTERSVTCKCSLPNMEDGLYKHGQGTAHAYDVRECPAWLRQRKLVRDGVDDSADGEQTEVPESSGEGWTGQGVDDRCEDEGWNVL